MQPFRKFLFFITAFLPLATQASEISFPPAISSQIPKAVATFECVGLYWSPAEGAEDNPCSVQYRRAGAKKWDEALPLCYDARNREYRGSIVYLKPGSAYEVQLTLKKTGTKAELQAATWKSEAPVGKTIKLPPGISSTPLEIKEGGTPAGYVVYTGAEDGSTVIDVDQHADSCVVISAPYIVFRNVTLKGAARDAILLVGAVHDVVIEKCDISNWGRIAPDGWGEEMDAAVKASTSEVERIVVQRTKMHHPRPNANDWSQPRVRSANKKPNPHPIGPQGIVFKDSKGNHVLRYNEIYSDEEHRFNDGMGGAANFSYEGFPGPDSDVYGNYVANTADDALEIEGGGRNVRVWGNYIDYAMIGIATVVDSVGPLYIFRNVYAVSRRTSNWEPPVPPDPAGIGISAGIALDNRGTFSKVSDAQAHAMPDGSTQSFGGGRRYFFHNTLLQPASPNAGEPTRGARCGIGRWSGAMLNTVSRNNIYDVAPISPIDGKIMSWSVFDVRRSPTNDLDYDLCTSEIIVADGQETHAFKGAPVYAAGNGAQSGRGGRYELAPSSPGFGKAQPIPNFNHIAKGHAPDVGACQSGMPSMEFGVNAYASPKK